jgi:hypothetical protein
LALSDEQVVEVLERPEAEFPDRGFRRIRQAPLDASHVPRVVFEEDQREIVVVTFYQEGALGMQALYNREDDVLTLELGDGPIDHAEEVDGVNHPLFA